MKKFAMAAATAALALTAGACTMQQSTPQQLNTTNANSRIYIGALTCNIAGGTGYVLGSSKSMECVFLGKDGVSSAQYTGTINKVGIDIGYTKAVHTVWRVYSLGSVQAATALSRRHRCRRAGHGRGRWTGLAALALRRSQRRDRHGRLGHRAGGGLQSRYGHRRDVAQAQALGPDVTPLPSPPATLSRWTATCFAPPKW